jgi:hypothetical protein
MRLLTTIYLIAYFLLVSAATVVLWRAGIVDHLPTEWVVLAILIAVGFGLLLALISPRQRSLTKR